MELNEFHRKALLIALEKANNELDLAKKTLNKLIGGKDASHHVKHHLEIDIFLGGEKVSKIKESLIANDIDY